jgi:hypothetical protein
VGDRTVDERVPIVPKDPKVTIEVEVDRRGLKAARVERVDANPAGLHGCTNVTVGQD